eukprot:g2139.t1
MVWAKHYDEESKQHYYYNHVTGESSWDKPDEFAAIWIKLFDHRATSHYYYCPELNISQYKKPVDAECFDYSALPLFMVPKDLKACIIIQCAFRRNRKKRSFFEHRVVENEATTENIVDETSVVDVDYNFTNENNNSISDKSSSKKHWVKLFDHSSGHWYYYDEANDTSQWEQPSDFVQGFEFPLSLKLRSVLRLQTFVRRWKIKQKIINESWCELYDYSSGHYYYYNSYTDTSQWERPLSCIALERDNEVKVENFKTSNNMSKLPVALRAVLRLQMKCRGKNARARMRIRNENTYDLTQIYNLTKTKMDDANESTTTVNGGINTFVNQVVQTAIDFLDETKPSDEQNASIFAITNRDNWLHGIRMSNPQVRERFESNTYNLQDFMKIAVRVILSERRLDAGLRHLFHLLDKERTKRISILTLKNGLRNREITDRKEFQGKAYSHLHKLIHSDDSDITALLKAYGGTELSTNDNAVIDAEDFYNLMKGVTKEDIQLRRVFEIMDKEQNERLDAEEIINGIGTNEDVRVVLRHSRTLRLLLNPAKWHSAFKTADIDASSDLSWSEFRNFAHGQLQKLKREESRSRKLYEMIPLEMDSSISKSQFQNALSSDSRIKAFLGLHSEFNRLFTQGAISELFDSLERSSEAIPSCSKPIMTDSDSNTNYVLSWKRFRQFTASVEENIEFLNQIFNAINPTADLIDRGNLFDALTNNSRVKELLHSSKFLRALLKPSLWTVVFDRADKNSDGFLTKEEFIDLGLGIAYESRSQQQIIDDLFRFLDADGDETLSWSEVRKRLQDPKIRDYFIQQEALEVLIRDTSRWSTIFGSYVFLSQPSSYVCGKSQFQNFISDFFEHNSDVIDRFVLDNDCFHCDLTHLFYFAQDSQSQTAPTLRSPTGRSIPTSHSTHFVSYPVLMNSLVEHEESKYLIAHSKHLIALRAFKTTEEIQNFVQRNLGGDKEGVISSREEGCDFLRTLIDHRRDHLSIAIQRRFRGKQGRIEFERRRKENETKITTTMPTVKPTADIDIDIDSSVLSLYDGNIVHGSDKSVKKDETENEDQEGEMVSLKDSQTDLPIRTIQRTESFLERGKQIIEEERLRAQEKQLVESRMERDREFEKRNKAREERKAHGHEQEKKAEAQARQQELEERKRARQQALDAASRVREKHDLKKQQQHDKSSTKSQPEKTKPLKVLKPIPSKRKKTKKKKVKKKGKRMEEWDVKQKEIENNFTEQEDEREQKIHADMGEVLGYSPTLRDALHPQRRRKESVVQQEGTRRGEPRTSNETFLTAIEGKKELPNDNVGGNGNQRDVTTNDQDWGQAYEDEWVGQEEEEHQVMYGGDEQQQDVYNHSNENNQDFGYYNAVGDGNTYQNSNNTDGGEIMSENLSAGDIALEETLLSLESQQAMQNAQVEELVKDYCNLSLQLASALKIGTTILRKGSNNSSGTSLRNSAATREFIQLRTMLGFDEGAEDRERERVKEIERAAARERVRERERNRHAPGYGNQPIHHQQQRDRPYQQHYYQNQNQQKQHYHGYPRRQPPPQQQRNHYQEWNQNGSMRGFPPLQYEHQQGEGLHYYDQSLQQQGQYHNYNVIQPNRKQQYNQNYQHQRQQQTLNKRQAQNHKPNRNLHKPNRNLRNQRNQPRNQRGTKRISRLRGKNSSHRVKTKSAPVDDTLRLPHVQKQYLKSSQQEQKIQAVATENPLMNRKKQGYTNNKVMRGGGRGGERKTGATTGFKTSYSQPHFNRPQQQVQHGLSHYKSYSDFPTHEHRYQQNYQYAQNNAANSAMYGGGSQYYSAQQQGQQQSYYYGAEGNY